MKNILTTGEFSQSEYISDTIFTDFTDTFNLSAIQDSESYEDESSDDSSHRGSESYEDESSDDSSHRDSESSEDESSES